VKRVSSQIGDPRFLETVKKFLRAGYIDPNTSKLVRIEMGTPQGGVLSPLLANIVLHELDKYMAKTEASFSKGTKRRKNPAYAALEYKRANSNDPTVRKQLLNDMRTVRRSRMNDPNFRRLMYIRYADDFVVFVTGTLKEAEFIKNNLKDYLLSCCGLELNVEKSSITSVAKKWCFLGAEIKRIKPNSE